MGASVWRLGRTAEEILGEGCGGLDEGKCLESGTNSRRSADVEDWMGASVWRVGRTAEEILGEGCGGLDGG